MDVTVAGLVRCAWAGADPLYVAYHDEEWGVPCHDDRELFERLLLESFQAGLSWITILRKRERFRAAFDNFDPVKVAAYGADDYHRLMADPGIVRNRLKVLAASRNARVFLEIQAELGSFDRYIWSFAPDPTPRRQRPATLAEVPATSPESDALSKDLKRRGMTFVGSTICYAFLQSIGVVDDHVASCFRSGAGNQPI
ncbi:MAG: DNA-3-methyladenine glycosylase I [Chloroflexia bacterium]|nr:DNA-3-methyladenine glycosylase I [Chloroflexia bacterium]MDQ3411211.1 DNA-3-methyladenine glycosylase I [Chloroflexota bacterium]